ncbi:hypothetical protein SERLA73DRAFT_174412 [Serpula lacrymans var. lacrymans S7.3]|uniref:Uncharacterized protein n=1 Tax=Serpula lacrymans var. lacrymans (strain S7.3) TaxID=936435 RepID=F8PFM5_SERL3|nr:hypothetical protein SERLA73DRAFT_174412 [Serpula lacrymans var. lacrymans S7.3]
MMIKHLMHEGTACLELLSSAQHLHRLGNILPENTAIRGVHGDALTCASDRGER